MMCMILHCLNFRQAGEGGSARVWISINPIEGGFWCHDGGRKGYSNAIMMGGRMGRMGRMGMVRMTGMVRMVEMVSEIA